MNAEIAQLLQLESDIGTNYVEQSLGYKPEKNEYGLTETEFLVIRMLVSNGQSLIQQHLYEKRQQTKLESLLCGYLDAALEKIPKEDTVGYVYRVTSQNILSPSDKSSVVSYPAYLTASKQWLSSNDNCSLIIRLAGRTKARSVYKAYEMNQMLPEEQVTDIVQEVMEKIELGQKSLCIDATGFLVPHLLFLLQLLKPKT